MGLARFSSPLHQRQFVNGVRQTKIQIAPEYNGVRVYTQFLRPRTGALRDVLPLRARMPIELASQPEQSQRP